MLLVGSGTALASDYFSDVDDDHPFHNEISRMFEERITTGFQVEGEDPEYRPNLEITRQAIIAFAYRAAGEPEGDYTESFSDVEPGDPFYNEIAWAETTGVTDGYPDGTFRPTDNVTREAFTAFVYRLSGEPTGDFSESFTDVDEDDTFYTAIAWAAENGVVDGYPDDTFRPSIDITRQAVAALFIRAIDNGFFGPNQAFNVTPSESSLITVDADPTDDTDDLRSFTVEGLEVDTVYDVALFPCSDDHDTPYVTQMDGNRVLFADQDLDDFADFVATTDDGDVWISEADGNDFTSGTTHAEFAADATTTTIDVQTTDAGDCGLVVIWNDDEAGTDNDQLDLDEDSSDLWNEPSEPFAISGETTYTSGEAPNGYSGGHETIIYVDKDADMFVIEDGEQIFYDSDDDISYNGDAGTFNISASTFESYLNPGDNVDFGSCSRDGSSSFELDEDVPTEPTNVTAQVGDFDGDGDGDDVMVSWDASSLALIDQYCVTQYEATANGEPTSGTATGQGCTTEGSDDTSLVIEEGSLTAGDFVYSVYAQGEASDENGFESMASNAVTVEGPPGPTIDDAVLTADDVIIGAIDSGDEWTLIFDQTLDAIDDGDVVQVRDEDGAGDLIRVECDTGDDTVGTGNVEATCVLSTTTEANDTLTITLEDDPANLDAAGDEDFLYPATITDTTGITASGVETDLANSTDVVIGEGGTTGD